MIFWYHNVHTFDNKYNINNVDIVDNIYLDHPLWCVDSAVLICFQCLCCFPFVLTLLLLCVVCVIIIVLWLSCCIRY